VESNKYARLSKLRQEVATWLVMLGMALFGSVSLLSVIDGIWISEDRWIVAIAKEHFAAIVGLPAAATAALFVVSIFEITAGPIHFESNLKELPGRLFFGSFASLLLLEQ
jgi:fatty acid desaturase